MPHDMTDLLHRDAVAVKLEAATAGEVIRHLAARLEQLGHVKPSYADAAIAREGQYPTGLPLGRDNNVAVPHTDPQHVISPAIAVATLARPVTFANMEDPDEAVPVGLVFMLALNDKDAQIEMLQEVMATIQDESAIDTLLSLDSADAIIASLRNSAPAA